MIEALIVILVVALVCYLIFWIAGQFIQGTPLKIIGAVIALLFCVYALQRIGVLRSLNF